MNLETDIVVTCECGSLMLPVISEPREILFICEKETCFQQVNVTLTTRAKELEAHTV